jgi:hypothetical protein
VDDLTFGVAAVPYILDEADTLAWQGPDPLLCLATVAYRSPNRIDACCQCCFRNNAPAPDCGHKIVLADDTLAVCDQIDQQIESLRLDGYWFVSAPELAPVRI